MNSSDCKQCYCTNLVFEVERSFEVVVVVVDVVGVVHDDTVRRETSSATGQLRQRSFTVESSHVTSLC